MENNHNQASFVCLVCPNIDQSVELRVSWGVSMGVRGRMVCMP